jgi:hypothetical protein
MMDSSGSRAFSSWLVTLALAFMGVVSLTGCASMRPAPVVHLVYFQLSDPSPANVDALLADCDRLLPGIPGVLSYAAGRHLETGRPAVVADYDLALLIGFVDEAAYLGYVEHPDHQELVALWKSHFRQLVVRDFFDASP